MSSVRKTIIEFYRKNGTIKFSKNIWLDLAGHALIGTTIGTIIILVRDVAPMPVLLLTITVTTAFGLRNHLKN